MSKIIIERWNTEYQENYIKDNTMEGIKGLELQFEKDQGVKGMSNILKFYDNVQGSTAKALSDMYNIVVIDKRLDPRKENEVATTISYTGTREQIVVEPDTDKDYSQRPPLIEIFDENIPRKYRYNRFRETLANETGLSFKVLGMLLNYNLKKRYNKSVIKKRSGKFRVLHVPTPALRSVQKVIKDVYLDQLWVDLEKNNADDICVYSYRKGIDTHTFQQLFVPYKKIYSYDLADFFTSIRPSHVREALKEMGVPKYIRYMISAYCSTKDTVSFDDKDGNKVHRSVKYLPQGTCTSPILSNIVGHFTIDKDLRAHAAKYNLFYGRYSDDINFAGNDNLSQNEFKEFYDGLKAILYKHKFRLNYAKNKSLPKCNRQWVLGMIVNDKVSIAKNQYKKYRAIVHNVNKNGFIKESQKKSSKQFYCPAHMYYNYKWQFNYIKTVDDNPKLGQLAVDLEKAAKKYPIQVSTVLYNGKYEDFIGTEKIKRKTIKLYIDGYSRKDGSGILIYNDAGMVKIHKKHKYKKNSYYAELDALLHTLEHVVGPLTMLEKPIEILTDSNSVFASLIQHKYDNDYHKMMYKVTKLLEECPVPIIVHNIPRELNLADHLKNEKEVDGNVHTGSF